MNNACYAIWTKAQTEGADYTPTIDIKVCSQNTDVYIIIADNGVGMTDEVKQHLYENFYTTKPAGQGTGLGMEITRSIVEEKHHGKLSFESEAGKGTRFTIKLPMNKS